ncbi:MAG: type II toxin-antitoxin system HicB family antitoxin [Gammaproteobacteria bacterium]
MTGETPEEAIANGKDAFACWMAAHTDAGRETPRPGESASGRFVTRVPKGSTPDSSRARSKKA